MSPLPVRPEHLSDPELVELAKQGDTKALDALLRRHYGRIHAVCRRITGHDADALDAAQNAVVSIARSIQRFDGSSAFTTWAYRVATNASLDELRRRKRRPEPSEIVDSYDGSIDSGRGTIARGDSRTPLDERASMRIDVDRALAKLPPDFRAAVVLRDLCGLDYAEIAGILGIPGGTVRSRIARGRLALAPLLGNPGALHERPTSTSRTDHE